MIKVEDTNEDLSLKDLLSFFSGNRFSSCKWEVFDLEYSGCDFNGSSAETMERKSKDGVTLSCEDFLSFVSTIKQVIEGVFVLRSEDMNPVPDRRAEGALIKILISDGSFWEVGGENADEFINSSGLIRIENE